MNQCTLIITTLFGIGIVSTMRAGTELKWTQVPLPVRVAVLANGGVAGQSVDRESAGHNVNGRTVYEAGIKEKDGSKADLVITEDGQLVEAKHDDASDAAAERVERAHRILAGVRFSHPREITNPFLPLASLKQDVLQGAEHGHQTRVERTAQPERHKSFRINGQTVEALAVEDREFVSGKLQEIATDYFAQDDQGNVYYLGEEVDQYKHGKVTGHEGAWLFGKDTAVPGILLPAHPKDGDHFRSEDVSAEINELDVVVATAETVTVPAGTYHNCVKIEEHSVGEAAEYKYYAPGVGVVREAPADGNELLISHSAN